jgi:hypothetical protein
MVKTAKGISHVFKKNMSNAMLSKLTMALSCTLPIAIGLPLISAIDLITLNSMKKMRDNSELNKFWSAQAYKSVSFKDSKTARALGAWFRWKSFKVSIKWTELMLTSTW